MDVIASLERRGLLEKKPQATGAGKGTCNLYLIKTFSSTETTVENGWKSDADNGETSKVVQDTPPPHADAAPPTVQQTHRPSASPALKKERTNKPHLKNPHSSTASERVDADMDLLKTEIEYGYFEEQMPDKLPFIDTLLGFMLALRRENATENQRLLAELDSCVVLEFLDEMKGRKLTDVHSYAAWLKRVFMDFLRKRGAELAALKRRVPMSRFWDSQSRSASGFSGFARRAPVSYDLTPKKTAMESVTRYHKNALLKADALHFARGNM